MFMFLILYVHQIYAKWNRNTISLILCPSIQCAIEQCAEEHNLHECKCFIYLQLQTLSGGFINDMYKCWLPSDVDDTILIRIRRDSEVEFFDHEIAFQMLTVLCNKGIMVPIYCR